MLTIWTSFLFLLLTLTSVTSRPAPFRDGIVLFEYPSGVEVKAGSDSAPGKAPAPVNRRSEHEQKGRESVGNPPLVAGLDRESTTSPYTRYTKDPSKGHKEREGEVTKTRIVEITRTVDVTRTVNVGGNLSTPCTTSTVDSTSTPCEISTTAASIVTVTMIVKPGSDITSTTTTPCDKTTTTQAPVEETPCDTATSLVPLKTTSTTTKLDDTITSGTATYPSTACNSSTIITGTTTPPASTDTLFPGEIRTLSFILLPHASITTTKPNNYTIHPTPTAPLTTYRPSTLTTSTAFTSTITTTPNSNPQLEIPTPIISNGNIDLDKFGDYIATQIAQSGTAKSGATPVPVNCVGCGDTITKPYEGAAGRLSVREGGVLRGVMVGIVVGCVVAVVGLW